MHQYIALIHKDPGSDYGVSFPDLPGVITAGRTLDEAQALAEEALAFHLEGLIEDVDLLPEPSSLETIMSQSQNRDGVAVIVAARTDRPASVRVVISLAHPLLVEIDRRARERGVSRSAFLSQAAKQALADVPAAVIGATHSPPSRARRRSTRRTKSAVP